MRVAFTSFRGGLGKSSIIASLASFMACEGVKVGVIDLNLRSPALHSMFHLPSCTGSRGICNYLLKRDSIEDIAVDLTTTLGEARLKKGGRLILVPSGLSLIGIVDLLGNGYEVSRVIRCFDELTAKFNLDLLLIDTPSGLDGDTLVAIAACHKLVVVLKPSEHDLGGTKMILDVAERFGKKDTWLLINQAPREVSSHSFTKLEGSFKSSVIAAIPFFEDLATTDLALLSLRNPEHEYTRLIQLIAYRILTSEPTQTAGFLGNINHP